MIAKDLMSLLPCYTLCGPELSVQAAMHFRFLRKRGVTIRKTIDSIIATFCIFHDHSLLHQDRDFEPFQQHLNLKAL